MRVPGIFKITTLICALLLLGSTIFVVINWSSMPDQIPTHFGFNGEANAYGGKGWIIFMVALSWAMLVGLSVTSKFPNAWNFPVKVTEENRPRLLAIGICMMEILKIVITLMMVVLIVCITKAISIPPVVMGIFVVLILVVTLGSMGLMKKVQ